MNNVLILSAGTRVAYCVAKNLKKYGLKTIVADSDPLAMSFWSNYVDKKRIYRSPYQNEDLFVEDLLRIIKDEQVDVLIPVLEETYFIARHRKRISPYVRLFIADYNDLISLHDKRSLMNIASRVGVRMPMTVELSTLLTEGIPENFIFPIVLKPKQGGGGWSVTEIRSENELLHVVHDLKLNLDRYLVQEKISGSIVGVAMLYRNGEMIASDSYLTLQTYPYPYGQPTVRLSHKAPQEMAALKLILDDMRWSGPCQADFLFDELRNESFLIDVNPRFWGSVGQSIARGIDFPYYYYKCAIGEQDLQVPIDPPVVATRWLGGDLMRKANNFLYKTEDVSQNRVRIPNKYAAMDDFEFSDPLPFVGWCASQLRRKVKSVIGFGSHRDALEGVWK